MPELIIVVTDIGGPSEWGDADHQGHLEDEKGEVLWGHYSSSAEWLEKDLTQNFGRVHELAARYPEGFTIRWRYDLPKVRLNDGPGAGGSMEP